MRPCIRTLCRVACQDEQYAALHGLVDSQQLISNQKRAAHQIAALTSAFEELKNVQDLVEDSGVVSKII